MFLSKIARERTGMYRRIWGNGKKKGSEEGSRWVRQSLIIATGCGSCAIENVKSHTDHSCIFLHVCWRLPKSIPRFIQTRISGTEVVNLAGLVVQLKVYEPWLQWAMAEKDQGNHEKRPRSALGDTAELINTHSSINNRPPGSGRKLQSLANISSVTAWHSITVPPDHNWLIGWGTLLTIKRKKYKMEMKK